jgi:ribosomal protein S6--L-glutamate ligase
MRIGVLLRRHPPGRRSPIMPEVVQLLTEWGCRVDLIYPEEGGFRLTGPSVVHDLYVLKSGSDRALSFAGALHALGAQILNPFPAAAVLRDKVTVSRVLEAIGIPTPATYFAAEPGLLATLLAEGPLVLKPCRGSQGEGIAVVHAVTDLARWRDRTGPVLAQRWMPHAGEDHKIYCIGGQVFGVRRMWPAETYEQKLGEPFTVTPELRDIALRCGAAFGLELFGLDVILSGGRRYVVDVNSFPGFKGVPDAALRLADHIYTTVRQAADTTPVRPKRIARLAS